MLNRLIAKFKKPSGTKTDLCTKENHSNQENLQLRRKIFLVVGPESTGTRLITKILSQHPDITGTLSASNHIDVLDKVWECIEIQDFEKATVHLSLAESRGILLSRRSLPHAVNANSPAKFMGFPNLGLFADFCIENDIELYLFVTSRSPIPTLISSVRNRASVSGSLERSKSQYTAAFKYLFEVIVKYDLPFSIISLEGLLNDKELYVNSLFMIMGLRPTDLDLTLLPDVNEKNYNWYTDNYYTN